MFLIHVALFKGEINWLSNGRRFITKTHCYNREIIYQTLISFLLVLRLYKHSNTPYVPDMSPLDSIRSYVAGLTRRHQPKRHVSERSGSCYITRTWRNLTAAGDQKSNLLLNKSCEEMGGKTVRNKSSTGLFCWLSSQERGGRRRSHAQVEFPWSTWILPPPLGRAANKAAEFRDKCRCTLASDTRFLQSWLQTQNPLRNTEGLRLTLDYLETLVRSGWRL